MCVLDNIGGQSYFYAIYGDIVKSGYSARVPIFEKLAARMGAYFRGVLIFMGW